MHRAGGGQCGDPVAEPSRRATQRAVRAAEQQIGLIGFDYRLEQTHEGTAAQMVLQQREP